MTKMWTLVLTVSFLVLSANTAPCQVVVSNNEQYFDISTNCSKDMISSSNSFDFLNKFPLEIAYIKPEGYSGYRYFKNKYQGQVDEVVLFIQSAINKHFPSQIGNLSIEVTFEAIFTEGNTLRKLKIRDEENRQNRIYDQGILRTQSIPPATKNIITRSFSGKGFHRGLNLSLELSAQAQINIDPHKCVLAIKEVLPETTYIDYDELGRKKTKKYEKVINIEKPKHLSKQYFYEYRINFSDLKEIGIRRYGYVYPIHLRYPQPSSLNYTKVSLHPVESVSIQCPGQARFEVIEDVFFDRGYADIPNGQINDKEIVSMITFIAMIIASMLLMRQLRK